MAVSVNDFVGDWTVQWVDGRAPVWAAGWRLCIGTGTEGDLPPFLNGEYQTCVGFALLEPAGEGWSVVLSSADQDEHNQPLALLYSEGNLRWAGYYEALPTRIYVSVTQVETVGGAGYASLYGATVYGDPDQVGVWGAEASPPPPP